MSNNHWIIDKVVAAGNRTLAWSSLNDHGPPSSTALLYRFLEELESGGAYEKEAAEICPRGARCAGTPKPPDEPFTCMSDDCPLKEARIRRAKNSDPQLLTRRCVKCGKRVGPGARTDVPGDGLPSDCQCDDPSLGTVPVTECPPPKMPERERDGVPGSRLVVKLDEAVACAEYWRDCARGWKEEAEDQRTRTKVQRDEATDAKDSLRKLQDRVADRDRQLEQMLADRKQASENAWNAEAEWNDLVVRYHACVHQLMGLFPRDPLPSNEKAYWLIDRLEALLRHGLLAPAKKTP